MPEDATRSSARWRAAALVLAFSACAVLASIVRATRWTMDADEAVHAIEGLRLFDDLAAGRWLDFARDTYFPERWHPPVDDHLRWYPFVHAWSVLPAFLLFGPSDFSARLPSVVFLFATALVFFALGERWPAAHVPEEARRPAASWRLRCSWACRTCSRSRPSR
jgi:hypothetical protein